MNKIKHGYFLFIFFFLISLVFPVNASSEVFEYKHRTGDRYRILSIVKENVYQDRRLTHTAEILNRITVEVTGERNGRGQIKAIFQTSEQTKIAGSPIRSQVYQWAREYESEFERDRLGYMTIDRKYFMPVVRNVPVFPDRELKPGDKWSAEGHEMHDFRDSFGISEPYRIPFLAHYTFLGDREWKGRTYPAFSVVYRILYEPAPVQGKIWPKQINGSIDDIVFWDLEQGLAVASKGEFRMILELSNGRTIEFRGNTEAEIYESSIMDKERIAREISEEIQRQNIQNVDVRVVEGGVTIELDDILFRADTAIMLPGEREKLDKIAEILKQYQDRDLLVGGHTALAGTEEGRMRLSTERAATVADYLIARNVRSNDRITIRGYGATSPIADNRTQEGMRRNRRVEITILEN